MSIYEKLSKVQSELVAPKNQFNSFGKYKYRSCEDILEGLKPICKEVKGITILTDKIVNIGERYYIEATATFIDVESGEKIEVVALARESLTKKGMDESQITGTASSYARKYALNGLYCIDDTKDADTKEPPKETTPGETTPGETTPGEKKPLSEAQIKRLYAIANSHKITKDDVKKVIFNTYKKQSANELTKKEYDEVIKRIEKK